MSKRDIEVDCCNGTFKKLAIAYLNNQDKNKIYCYEYDEDRNVIDIHYFEDKQKIFKDIIWEIDCLLSYKYIFFEYKKDCTSPMRIYICTTEKTLKISKQLDLFDNWWVEQDIKDRKGILVTVRFLKE